MSNQQLKDLYYSPTEGFMSLDKFQRKIKEKGYDIKQKDVKAFLEKQLTWQLNKQSKLPSKYSTYWVHKEADNYQIDLMVYDRYQYQKYKYILCLIDVKSRYAAARPLISKNQGGYVQAFESMCEEMGKWPKGISADKEFDTPLIRDLFYRNGARNFQFSEPNQIHKNPIVEQWHRTLAMRLAKWRRSETGLRNWPAILPKIVEGYSNSFHRTIQAKPIDVWEGRDYNKQMITEVPTNFHIGDKVKYRLDKKKLQKGDRPNYSRDTYIITAKTGKRFTLSRFTLDANGDVVMGQPLSRTRADYELIKADEVEHFARPEPEEPEPERPPRRLPKNDTNASNIVEGRRQIRGPSASLRR